MISEMQAESLRQAGRNEIAKIIVDHVSICPPSVCNAVADAIDAGMRKIEMMADDIHLEEGRDRDHESGAK